LKRILRTALPLTLGLLVGAAGVGRAQTPDTPDIQPARLDYKINSLPNGLKIVTLEDHRAPVVAIQVYYHVGSKDEAPGKAGFAHLFEHLMFKGSAHVGPEEHARIVERLGGFNNADTYFDRTRYVNTVPSNALERLLWLEADRMSSLNVDEANLRSERDVVKEEHRMDIENVPYGDLFEKVQALVFPKSHPYAHTTIGIMSDLDSAKLTDVRAFHDEYYKPDNATLVLVGDFQTSDALNMVRRYFAAVPRSKKPFTRYPVPPIDQKAERRAVFTDKLAPLPVVGMAYRTVPDNNPDTPVLDVIGQILSVGQSSRLNRALVRDQQIASDASGFTLSLAVDGLFMFQATANQGVMPAQIEKALQEQVDLLRDTPVSAAELAKAKNQALSGKVFGSLSTEQKAEQLGDADLDFGTPEEVNRELTKLNAVTIEDVQRVARKYFTPQHRSVFYDLPAAAAHKSGPGPTSKENK
jgi:zinc protease